MKILFIGTVDFSFKILNALINIEANIVGVCTKKSSSFNSDFFDLKPICDINSIPCHYIDDINSKENIEWINQLSPDIVFCFGWSSLLKKELLNLAPMGVIGYHPSKLPKNRGRHPLVWALALGLKETASTFFFMDGGVDSGDIISQYKIEITEQDDAQSLYVKIIDTATKQILEIIPDLNNGKYKRIQQKCSQANIWRKRTLEDGKIDWRMSAKQVHNLVRGLTHPYVGAHFVLKSKIYKVWKTKLIGCDTINNIEPGKVVKAHSQTLTVKCGEGCIEIHKVSPKIYVNVGDYL